MPYSLYTPLGSAHDGSDAAHPPITVQDNNIDPSFYDGGNKLGILLVGRNAIDYGTAVAQNTVQMISNFAGRTQPNTNISLQGQLWFNTTNGTLNVRTDATGIAGPATWLPIVVNTGGAISINISGNAGTATKLQTARTFSASGDATATAQSFDGTANVVLPMVLAASGVTGGTYNYPTIVVDAKGRITSASSNAVVTSFNTRTGAVTLTTTDVTTALGYIPSSGGVTSFNTRTGAVTLSSADVTGALGYTPSSGGVTTFNTRSGAVTLSSTDVTTALGYTPANSTAVVTSFNTRTGAITLSSTDVTNALGYTPGSGAGTVTTVSVVAANGVSGTVATPGTTPAITIALGAITPSLVNITTPTPSTSTGTGALRVAGGAGIAGDLWAANVFATGDVTAAASDSRLKTNLRKITEAVSKVQQLTGYTFEWDQPACAKAGFEFSKDRQVGVIAQDVQAVLPEAVAAAPGNDNYLTVKYEKLVALLIEAVKEQAKEIELIKKMIK